MGLHALTQQSDQTGEHVTPTIDDVIADLTGAHYFSKLDLGLVITNYYYILTPGTSLCSRTTYVENGYQ